MIALDNQPISIVEDIRFTRLLNHISPKYEIPSRKYFQEKVLAKIYEKLSNSISQLLEHQNCISFISDIWSDSHSNHSYISLSGHFIDASFLRKDVVLNVKHFPGSHTGNAISDIFHKMKDDWNIPDIKCHLLIRDNAANIRLGAELSNFNSESCFIHTLQLALNDGIFSQRIVRDIISNSRKIVGHFNHSPLACSRLQDIQNKLDLPQHKLIQDVTTRWNSTFYMLERLVEQRRAIGMYASDHYGITSLSIYQWQLTENILRLLQPFEEVTKRFSSNSACISEVIVEVQVLLRYLGRKENDEGVQTMKSELRDSINSRFVIKGEIFRKKSFCIATVLDPRFKTSFFPPESLDCIKNMIISEMDIKVLSETGLSIQVSDSLLTDVGICGTPPPKRSLREETHFSIRNCYDEIVQGALYHGEESSYGGHEQLDVTCGGSQNSIRNSHKFELERYLTDPLIPISEDPLLWWKINEKYYSNLLPVSLKYLSAPPTSIYSERLFSTAGNVFEEKRSSLLPENGERLIFIQKNLSLLNYKY